MIRGKTAWVVFDRQTTISSCKIAVDLIMKTIENAQIVTVIISHSYYNRYAAFYIKIYANEATSRRAQYMYRAQLKDSFTKETDNSTKKS
ncbi:hypothetical protein EIN_450900 [Entamoeba invadens IP1]|uniref:Uncharacterized protein n=1 Tax=Entamoeba invadens IP1 TaxID=370355 RepID=A0A0A1U9C2_ENTIV|nr:hypothetical protein EIN_450900 [Entamoeba invadens IP1]ELP91519.1 hypothetical protein EIN_450900 [Entamoeba invadens IP1]|eukprot:XP_004258290.1 hypothetical protein EIN_450900 [Entamoeba invadens IP1]